MGGVVTKEKEINHSQYLDLVYSESDTLYNLMPHAPRLSNDSSRPTTEAHADGVVGFVTNTKIASSLVQTFDVNSIFHFISTT
jgi:hypothetical protein